MQVYIALSLLSYLLALYIQSGEKYKNNELFAQLKTFGRERELPPCRDESTRRQLF